MTCTDLIKQSSVTLAKEMTEVQFADDPEQHQLHHQEGGIKYAGILAAATTINGLGGSIIVAHINNSKRLQFERNNIIIVEEVLQ